jgi:Zn finger protein HypA/HybF involved in hydrogenase expression
LKRRKKNNLTKITKAVIELGSIIEHEEEVLPENLKFNISMLAESGPAQGLEIEINSVAGDNWVLKDLEGEQ